MRDERRSKSRDRQLALAPAFRRAELDRLVGRYGIVTGGGGTAVVRGALFTAGARS
jgi:hypothetical protein